MGLGGLVDGLAMALWTGCASCLFFSLFSWLISIGFGGLNKLDMVVRKRERESEEILKLGLCFSSRCLCFFSG